jgi:hypothetical protein
MKNPASRLRTPLTKAIFVAGSTRTTTPYDIQKIDLCQVLLCPCSLIDKLQARQGNKFVLGKLKYPVKTGYGKDTSGCCRNIAENKPMTTVSQQLPQLQEL